MKIKNFVMAGLLFFASLNAITPSFAQNNNRLDLLEEERERQIKRHLSIKKSIKRIVEGDIGLPVTYIEILEAPDDIELNFRYARQQIDQGNLRSAAATLERILMVEPNLPEVRLYYGVVLFRLDNSDEAEQQFLLVRQLPLNATLKAEIENYLAAIKRRRQKTRWQVDVTFGGRFDRNRNAASKWGHTLLLDSHVALQGSERRKSDWGLLSTTSLQMRHDTGSQERNEILGFANYFRADQKERGDLSAQSGIIGGGMAFHLPFVDVTPTVFLSKIGLSHERYQSSMGANLRLDKKLSRDLKANATIKYTNEKFYHLTEGTSAYLYSGYRWKYSLGLDYRLSPAQSIGLNWGHTVKRAKKRYFEYSGNEVDLSHTWLLGEGQFLRTVASARYRFFREEDKAISQMTRRDKRFRGRLTYGLPLSKMLPDDLLDISRGWNWSTSGEYLWQQSNLLSYDYDNWGFQSQITRRWEF